MKTIVKYKDGGAVFQMQCGEVATLTKDVDGLWGFETNKGYNLWETPDNLSTKKSDIIKRMKTYDLETVKNNKYDN